MIYPFYGSYRVTQSFNDPCCRASYSKFGMQGHNGIDYGLPCGTVVLAPADGKIYRGYEANGYGNYIFITTNDGHEIVLGHLSQIDVPQGAYVSQGQRVGLSGTTGNSSGCHLHLGLRPIPANKTNGFLGYIDPAPYISASKPTGGGNVASIDEVLVDDYKRGQALKAIGGVVGIPADQVQLPDAQNVINAVVALAQKANQPSGTTVALPETDEQKWQMEKYLEKDKLK